MRREVTKVGGSFGTIGCMSISLNHENQEFIEELMKHDGYANSDEVVRAALESLRRDQEGDDFEAGELDQLLAEGERSGEALDGEQVLSEFRELRNRSANKAG